MKGYLAFVLHAHLPYVRHPEHESFLEERWFFEALTETYIPLIKVFHRLTEEQIRFQLTLSISPTLLAMMEDGLLQERYVKHISGLIELSEKELERTRHEPHFHYLAGIYRSLFVEAKDIFLSHDGRLAAAFRGFHRAGNLDLITTAATHALLPLHAAHPKAVSAQVKTGLRYFEKVMGFRPRGMWLPECGFYPGLDSILKKEGIRYFFLESHGLEHGSITPFYGVYAPVYTPSGIAAFGRDRMSTKQVWSARSGFPGHPDYREFYRDIGYDLDFDYIRPYIAGDVRVDTGIKYYGITGNTSRKEPYRPVEAAERAARHAGEFLFQRVAHIEHLSSQMETSPVVVAPFDAELFGHWWFEGPSWLDYVIRKAAFDQNTIELITPSEYLERHPVHQSGSPSQSTWGHKGFFETWLNGKTDWIYRDLFQCEGRMERLAARFAGQKPPALLRRALNQCVRELLLAQSSDWPFIINNGTASEYAVRRVKDHVARFDYLSEGIERNAVDGEYLAALEELNNFPYADYRLYI